MKRVLSLLIVIITMMVLSTVYAEDNEVLIVEVDFTDGLDNEFWVKSSNSTWNDQAGGVYTPVATSNRWLYENTNYNDGVLKSDYYRFEVIVNEKWSSNYYSRLNTGGLSLQANTSGVNVSNGTSSFLNAKKIKFKSDQQDSNKSYSATYSKRALKFIIELDRIGSSDKFNVTSNIYINDVLQAGYEKKKTTTLTAIYPYMFARSGEAAEFVSFKAYHVPENQDFATFTNLRHSENVMNIDWAVDTTKYSQVKIAYSTTSNINFNENVLYSGSSTGDALVETLPALDSFYIGVQGYGTGIQTNATVKLFNVALAPDPFYYQYTATDDMFTYTWDAVDDAYDYRVYNGTVMVPTTQTSLTLSDISDPEDVYIVTRKLPVVGSTKSYSVSGYPMLGDIGTIANLQATEDNFLVTLSWDELPGADSYNVYRDFGNDTFAILEGNLLEPSHITTLNSQNVISKYKVKGLVDGLLSGESNTITIKNIIQGLDANFDGEVKLSWDEIDDADNYKIRVSNSSNMSGSDTFYSTTNAYNVVVADDDTTKKYIEVTALKGSFASRSSLIEVELASNKTVQNLMGSANSTLHVVNLTWDEVPEAAEFLIFRNGVEVDSSDTNSYVYLIDPTDEDVISFSVQIVTSEMTYRESDAIDVVTFSNDFVRNLSATKISETDVIDLDWDTMYRATGYAVSVSDHADMSDAVIIDVTTSEYDYTILNSDGLIKYFTVKAKLNSTRSLTSAMVDSQANAAIDIEIDSALLDSKFYNVPLAIDLEFEVNEAALYEPKIEIKLNNVLYPSSTDVALQFVYPELGDITLEGYGGDLEYLTKVKNNGELGYTIEILFTNANIETIMTNGRKIVVPFRTDVIFAQEEVGVRSILYKGGSLMNWMELPFSVEEQILAINSRYAFDGGSILSNLYIQPTLSYHLNPGETSSSTQLFINFKNRTKIPDQ